MKKYKTYKDSGVEWIGEIPENWQINRLANFGNFLKGRGITKADLTDSGVQVILYGDIYTKYDLYAKKLERKTSYENAQRAIEIYKGDLLFTASGETKEDIGKCIVFLGEDKAYASGDVIIFRQLKNNSMFLAYVFNSYHVNIQKARLSKGEIVVHIYASQLRNIHFALPPLDEQTQIANYLDQKTAEIDTLIAKKEQLIKLLEEERTAMINQAVTKGLDLSVPMKDSGIDWLGEIPEHWEVARIKNLANIIGRIGFRGYTTADLVQEGEGAISLSPSNIKNQKLILKKCTYLSWNKYHESPEIKIYPNDILLVKTGSTIGKVALVPKKTPEMTLNPQLVVLKNIEINSKFLYLIMVSDYFQAYFSVYTAGGSTPAISQEKINNFKITYPDLNEQKKIVDKAFKEELRIYRLMETINLEIDLLKEYKTALISEVVTGKIDIRQEVLN